MAELDTRRNQVLGRSASIIQRKFRTYTARKIFISLRISATQIQALCRGQVARHLYENMRREGACLRIQREARKFLARKSYKRLCSSAVSIQMGMRGMAARIYLQYRKHEEAATRIQSHCRQYLARIHYTRLKRAAIVIQCAWRGKMARRELRMLKMAAKETGALQAAKSALEKQVEELTWRLQLEKRMKADMEEAKNQEISKLKSDLEEMRLQFQETKELLVKEGEASKKAAEQAPAIKEVPVTDDELVKKLTSENEELKALVDSLEKKLDETEKKYEETSKLSEERLKQAMEAESKIIQLKTAMQSLEEKLADMETEDQILRQQALLNSRKEMSENLSIKKSSENGHLERATPSKKFGTESFRKSMVERQRGQVDALMKCITQDLGFSEGKPVATFTIYKCLIHWKSFEAERTSVFDRLIQVIGSAIEDQTSTAHMAYWFSNTSMLLFLLQQTLRSTDSPQKPPPPTSLFGRMTQGFRSYPSSANLSISGLDGVRQVEAKYPALLFKQQLTAYVEKIYGIIRDNVKKDLSSLISSCVQAPRTSNEESSQSDSGTSPARHWQEIIDCINGLLNTLKENHIPSLLVQKIFTQIFSSINVQLFNSLLLHKECCTFSNGEYVKSGLDELEQWCNQAKEEYAGSSWDELKPVRQAVGFLVIHQKSRITYDDLTNDLCPLLSVHQLYRICTLYQDDNYNTPGVDQDVISSMKKLMTEDSDESDSSSFLLDENASIPLSIDDISSSLKQIDFKGVKPAAELLEDPEFQFLQE